MSKYQLETWETWESEATKHPPIFCPKCGEKGLRTQEYWVDSSRPSSPTDPFHGIGYDCFCNKCKWSGNIEPDIDLDIVDETYRKRRAAR